MPNKIYKFSDLHNYQIFCIKHGIEHEHVGLLLDMGLGKTVVTLTIINSVIYEELAVMAALVIAPKRVVESVWEEQAEEWEHLKHLKFSKIIGNQKQRLAAINAKADVYLISRDNIAWLCGLSGGMKLPFDMVIYDESSSFKRHDTQRFKAIKPIVPYIKRSIILTGTPAPNGYIGLWSQMYLLDMGQRLERTITKYRQTYFREGQKVGNVVYSYVLLSDGEQKINDKMKDICISMKSIDYLQMPMRTDNFINVRLSAEVQKQYDSFEKESIMSIFCDDAGEEKDITDITAVTAAALSNKLLQFANGAVYDENHNTHVIHDFKLDALEDIIEDANGQSVLIAWNYRHDRDRILERLKKYKPRELKTAQDIKDWNDGKVQVMLAHPASAGHGLNLQRGGSLIVWYSVNWSLELYQQFNSRVYRQGQDKHVIIHHLIAHHTHDEDVMKAIQAKDKKQEALLLALKAKILSYTKGIH